MRVKNDHRGEFSNLSNWKEEAWKKNPSFTIFLNKVSYVYQLEKKLMYSSNKVADQENKWEKFQLLCRGSEN